MKETVFLALVSVALVAFAGEPVGFYPDKWSFALDASQRVTAEKAEGVLSWGPVTIPHDWAIHGDWIVEGEGDKLPWRNAVGWYRCEFSLDEPLVSERMLVDFDGVMARSVVYLNGQAVGGSDYGYLGFCCDLTPYVVRGRNVLLVRADTQALSSRWYPGAGIVRRVRRRMVSVVHLERESLFVTTPKVSASSATIRVTGSVLNSSPEDVDTGVEIRLTNPQGRMVASVRCPQVRIPKFEAVGFSRDLTVDDPVLWELVDPAPLYKVEIVADSRGNAVRCADAFTLRTGIRSFEFSPADGFLLNGRRVQLKGVNLHSDMGILGMAFNRSVMRRQLRRMRDMGANALRTSHNAPAPELLELCDEMGIFVWNECFDKWNETCGRGEQNLEDFVSRHLQSWVKRDRNHPSVFVWSIGNEIPSYTVRPDRGSSGTTYERCARFRNAIRMFDTTRPVGIGSCFSEDAVSSGDYDCLDITGWNYGRQYMTYRRHQPNKPVLYTESASALSCNCFYDETLPTNKSQYAVAARGVDAMDRNSAPWSDIPDVEFERMEADRFVGGEFVWTGIDYLGEPYPYMKHRTTSGYGLRDEEYARSSYFGVCDLLAFPKDRYYLYRSHWNKQAFTLHVVPRHWNFKAGALRPVYVYSSAKSVELVLNGRSLGVRTKDVSINTLADGKGTTDGWSGENGGKDRADYYRIIGRYRFCWEDVVYEPGELKAIARDASGRVLGETVLRTAGDPVAVRLMPEETTLPADGETLVFVRVCLVDKNGTEVPERSDFIRFRAEGPGDVLAVGNADPRQVQRRFDQVDGHCLYQGQAGLVLRRRIGENGTIRIIAEREGVCRSEVIFD